MCLWVQTVLAEAPKEAFKRIATCDTINNMFRERFGQSWLIDVLWGMNEVQAHACIALAPSHAHENARAYA